MSSSLLNRPLCLALLLGAPLIGAGCDTPPSADAAAAAAVAAPAVAAPVAPADVPYDVCLTACGESSMSADNKATCRLNCRANDKIDRRNVGAAVPPATSLADLHHCHDACTTDADAAGCANACIARAARGEPVISLRPAGAGDGFQACAEACLGTVINCSGACDDATPKMSVDDRATCRVQCDAVGAVCIGECRS